MRKSKKQKPVRRHRTLRAGFQELESRRLLSATSLPIDLNPTGASAPTELTVVGDLMYFAATNGANGRELWVTDGTTQGTRMVKDIALGLAASSPTDLVAIGTTLYFVATDGTNGRELWKSDGTALGTVMVMNITPTNTTASAVDNLVAVGGMLYFTANNGVDGVELWKSDGTSSGTAQVRNIATAANTSSSPANLVEVGGVLYFSADDGINGRELWKSDGTASGTVLVKDINTGTFTDSSGTAPVVRPRSSSPGMFTVAGNTLYFVATDFNFGAELWKSDGTAAGTVRVADLRQGSGSAFVFGDQQILINGVLYFSADDGVNGRELWKLDTAGTSGPVLVKDIRASAEGSLNVSLAFAEYNGKLYFSADNGINGKELWVSDGTAAGTVLLADLDPGTHKNSSNQNVPNDTFPFYFAKANGLLYFTASTATAGRELWRTDGTTAGTRLATDAIYGPSGEEPLEITGFKGAVYYSGADASGARELRTLVEDSSFQLSVMVNGTPVAIPSLVGVEADGSKGAYYTLNNSGLIFLNGTGQKLGGFFDMWRTDAGQAGENANAFLSSTRLMGSMTDGQHAVQMFVNGQIVSQFGDYVIQAGDDVVLVYTSNPVVSIITNVGAIVIELFESQKPGTVDNFLDYIRDGNYLNSIFHRSAKNFVIQGGGFTTNSPTYTNTNQFTAVPSKGQIQNEPGISNLRGTLAMAKLSGNPNSATSQFFINLSDNNSFLDTAANNAFTVFGRVLSMSTVDDIAGLPITDVDGAATSSAYGEVPMAGNNQLVVVSAIKGYGSLTGVKFRDLDADGVFDTTDIAQSGVVVYIDKNNNGVLDSDEVSTTTDSQGRYLLHAEPGNYTVRAVPTGGVVTTQAFYSVSVELGREDANLNFGEQPVVAPSGVNLVDASDTGLSNTDNLTKLNNASTASALTFSVTGVTAGAQVRLYAGDVLIGTATATGDQVLVATDGTTTLANGEHAITATVTFGGLESNRSTALGITVDSVAPGGVTTNLPEELRIDQVLSVDLHSPNEGAAATAYSLVGAPAGMTINPTTGQLTWAPTANQTGPEAFDVVISDAAGNTSTKTFELTVLGVIAARLDEYEVNEDATLNVGAAEGVLNNDGDGSIDGLTVSVVSQPQHGVVTLNADGSFSYTPAANFSGVDTFTYKSTNGTDESNVATVKIVVNPQQDAPAPVADSYTTNEDQVLTVPVASGVLANDIDVDGDTLTAAVVAGPAHGTLALNANGSFTYTPAANYFGQDTFTYSVSDGVATSEPITVTLTVMSVNDNPTVVNDTYTIAEDSTLTVPVATGVLANDSDIDSTTLTVAVVTAPAHGTLTLNADGSFVYKPAANYFGADTFTYRTSDGNGGFANGTVSLTVTGVADAPVGVNDSFTAPNDGTATTLNVLTNDTDADGTSSLKVTAVSTGSLGGTITISADGRSLVYKAPLEGVGNDVFTYTVKDAEGNSSTATVTVNVYDAGSVTIRGFAYVDKDADGVRDTGEVGIPGVLVTLTGTDVRGFSVSRSMLTGNDGSYSFAELSSGTYKIVESQPAAHTDGADKTTVPGATLTNDTFSNLVVSGNNVYSENNFGEKPLGSSYVTLAWFLASAPAPAVQYRKVVADAEQKAGHTALALMIRDGGSASEINTSPAAFADAFAATEDTPLTVTAANGVLKNDTDTENDPLTASVTQSPSHGTLSLAANGSFTYTPAANYSGQDTFKYRVSDGQFWSPAVTVTITVANVNDDPVANNDAYQATSGTTLTVPVANGVLKNDTDIDGDTLAAVIVNQPTNGTVTMNSNGSFAYVPNTGFSGTDTFTYRASDPGTKNDTATVTITVSAAQNAITQNDDDEMAALLDALDAALEETEDWNLAI
jgi:ELWxxDGT repeat protein/VCBS repeat-containing protein